MIQKMQVITLRVKKAETENTKLRLTAPYRKTLCVCKKLNIIYNIIFCLSSKTENRVKIHSKVGILCNLVNCRIMKKAIIWVLERQ